MNKKLLLTLTLLISTQALFSSYIKWDGNQLEYEMGLQRRMDIDSVKLTREAEEYRIQKLIQEVQSVREELEADTSLQELKDKIDTQAATIIQKSFKKHLKEKRAQAEREKQQRLNKERATRAAGKKKKRRKSSTGDQPPRPQLFARFKRLSKLTVEDLPELEKYVAVNQPLFNYWNEELTGKRKKSLDEVKTHLAKVRNRIDGIEKLKASKATGEAKVTARKEASERRIEESRQQAAANVEADRKQRITNRLKACVTDLGKLRDDIEKTFDRNPQERGYNLFVDGKRIILGRRSYGPEERSVGQQKGGDLFSRHFIPHINEAATFLSLESTFAKLDPTEYSTASLVILYNFIQIYRKHKLETTQLNKITRSALITFLRNSAYLCANIELEEFAEEKDKQDPRKELYTREKVIREFSKLIGANGEQNTLRDRERIRTLRELEEETDVDDAFEEFKREEDDHQFMKDLRGVAQGVERGEGPAVVHGETRRQAYTIINSATATPADLRKALEPRPRVAAQADSRTSKPFGTGLTEEEIALIAQDREEATRGLCVQGSMDATHSLDRTPLDDESDDDQPPLD